jgi:hypothetical protein
VRQFHENATLAGRERVGAVHEFGRVPQLVEERSGLVDEATKGQGGPSLVDPGRRLS